MSAPSLRPHVTLAAEAIKQIIPLADGGFALLTEPSYGLELFDETLAKVGSITGNGTAFEHVVPTQAGFLAYGKYAPLHEGVVGGAFAPTKLGKEECRKVVATSTGFLAVGKKRVLLDANGTRTFLELSGRMEHGGAEWREGAVTCGNEGLAFLGPSGEILSQTNDKLTHAPKPFANGLACGDVLVSADGRMVGRLVLGNQAFLPFRSGLLQGQKEDPSALWYTELQGDKEERVWSWNAQTTLRDPLVAGEHCVVTDDAGATFILDANGQELARLELPGWLDAAVPFGGGIALHVLGIRDILWWQKNEPDLIPLPHDVQPSALSLASSAIATSERKALYVWHLDDPGPEYVPEPSPMPLGTPLVVDGDVLTLEGPGRVLLRGTRWDGASVGVERDARFRPAVKREAAAEIVKQMLERKFDDTIPALVTQAAAEEDRFRFLSELRSLPPSETVSLQGRALFAPAGLSKEVRAIANSLRSDFLTELGLALGLSRRVVYASIRARQLPPTPPTTVPGFEYLGRFESSDSMYVCDPCYIRNAKLRIPLSVHAGMWHVFARSGSGKHERYTAELVVIHDSGFSLPARRQVGTVGVDSGNAGVFDASCPKPNLDEQHEEGVFDGRAAFVSSGFGDGLYPAFVADQNGRVAKIRIPFLTEDPSHDSSLTLVSKESAKRYTIAERFALGDSVEHAKYGVGTVVEVGVDDKIAVRFSDGSTRRLIHGKT